MAGNCVPCRKKNILYAIVIITLLIFLCYELTIDNYSIVEYEERRTPCLPPISVNKYKLQGLHTNASKYLYRVELWKDKNEEIDVVGGYYSSDVDILSISRHLLSRMDKETFSSIREAKRDNTKHARHKNDRSGVIDSTPPNSESTTFYTRNETNQRDSYTIEDITGERLQAHGSSVSSEIQTTPNTLIPTYQVKPLSIAIALGVTSATLDPHMNKATMLKTFPTFKELLPSFCKTASCGYSYHFYFAYDYNDGFFTNITQRHRFILAFHETISRNCPMRLPVDLELLECNHSKKPAWAQNDAAYAAYLDHHDYIYRVNDDSRFESRLWVEYFINALLEFDPPNVGVVGPHHRGGLTTILTYDFTHRTHQDIFGLHYPRVFTDWSADSWISMIYKPGRLRKVTGVKLFHSETLGRRYENHSKKKIMPQQIEKDQLVLRNYLTKTENNKHITPCSSKVIAVSLYGTNPNYTHGAIRIAQTVSLYYPDWTLRIYTPHPEASMQQQRVPEKFLKKLIRLGAQLFYVNTSSLNIPLQYMALAVADDMSVEYFLIRNANERFSDREKVAVSEWMESEAVFHCIRDHHLHSDIPLVPGLFGAKRRQFVKILNVSVLKLLQEMSRNNLAQLKKHNILTQTNLLTDVLWEKFSDHALCHDSSFCKANSSSENLTLSLVQRNVVETFIGEKFDAFDNPMYPERRWQIVVCPA